MSEIAHTHDTSGPSGDTVMSLAYDLHATPLGRDIETQFTTQAGDVIPVTGRVTGPETGEVVLALGGISAGRFVCSDEGIRGWWCDQAGPGRPIDTEETRLLGMDFVGETAHPFPTTHDQARAALAIADAAGIERFSVIGASYGGMIALALAELAPERIERALVLSAADRSSEMAKAWRAIQRDTVEMGLRLGDPEHGLNLARRLALTTYRTPDEWEDRFGNPEPDSRDAQGVCAYLEARGADFCTHQTAERFLALSRSTDSHGADVTRIACPVTYLAVEEDRLVPLDTIQATCWRTPQGRMEVTSSYYGHDAFLKENTLIAQIIRESIFGLRGGEA